MVSFHLLGSSHINCVVGCPHGHMASTDSSLLRIPLAFVALEAWRCPANQRYRYPPKFPLHSLRDVAGYLKVCTYAAIQFIDFVYSR